MRYVLIVLALLSLCACQTTGKGSSTIQAAPSVTAAEAYNSCMKINGLIALQGGADSAMATDTAMGICSSEFTAMRKEHAKRAKAAGEKPTQISDRLYNPKAKAAVRDFYVNYFANLDKGA